MNLDRNIVGSGSLDGIIEDDFFLVEFDSVLSLAFLCDFLGGD